MNIVLQHAADREGFHRALARLLREDVPEDAVHWSFAAGDMTVSRECAPHAAPPLRLPREFTALADLALLHSDEDRFLRLHRFARRLWRDPRHMADVLHPERRHLESLARQVRRDMHKMKAFVRFVPVGTASGESPAEYVAWFEPRHHIVQAIADFFVGRFASMRWSILTPLGSLRWDGERLFTGPAASRADAPAADAGQALWLAYYAHIFNPARVKARAMQREMPVYYWKNLPEAALIPQLLAQSAPRTQAMLAHRETGSRSGRGRCAPVAPADPLARLRGEIQACDACECALRATQAVAGEGPGTARWMVVGEQPGDGEDLTGRPFVGPAGELLRSALQEAGIDPGMLYLTNAVKHFRYEMRGKRRVHKTPAQQDRLRCAEWLGKELALIRPAAVLALGRTALESLRGICGTAQDGQSLRTPEGAPVFVVAHPAALLRAGEQVGSAGYRRWVGQIGAALRSAEAPAQ